MKNMCFKPVSFLLGLTALTIVSSAVSARAEMPSTNSSVDSSNSSEATAAPVQTTESAVMPVAPVDPIAVHSTSSGDSSEAAAPVQAAESAVTPVAPVDPLALYPSVTEIPQDTTFQGNDQQASLADSNEYQADSQIQSPEAMRNDQPTSSEVEAGVSVTEPVLEKVETSAAYLQAQPAASPEASAVPEESSDEADNTVAQTDVEPGRTTRGGRSYIGVGGNIGLGGDSSLGDSSFTIISKLGLTRTFSARPAALIGDGVTFLLPVTYDFVIQTEDPFAEIPFAPYAGGGISIDDDGDIAFLLSGGLDFPLSRQFVGNAAINLGIGDDTAVGLLVGVGYTFTGF